MRHALVRTMAVMWIASAAIAAAHAADLPGEAARQRAIKQADARIKELAKRQQDLLREESRFAKANRTNEKRWDVGTASGLWRSALADEQTILSELLIHARWDGQGPGRYTTPPPNVLKAERIAALNQAGSRLARSLPEQVGQALQFEAAAASKLDAAVKAGAARSDIALAQAELDFAKQARAAREQTVLSTAYYLIALGGLTLEELDARNKQLDAYWREHNARIAEARMDPREAFAIVGGALMLLTFGTPSAGELEAARGAAMGACILDGGAFSFAGGAVGACVK